MGAGLLYNRCTHKMVSGQSSAKHRDGYMLDAAVGWQVQSDVMSKQTQLF